MRPCERRWSIRHKEVVTSANICARVRASPSFALQASSACLTASVFPYIRRIPSTAYSTRDRFNTSIFACESYFVAKILKPLRPILAMDSLYGEMWTAHCSGIMSESVHMISLIL